MALATIDDDFGVRLPVAETLYERYQLERFAEWQAQDERTAAYRITADAVWLSQDAGIKIEQILAFLRRIGGENASPVVLRTLQAWGGRFGRVFVRPRLVLQTAAEATMQQLLHNAQIRACWARRWAPRPAWWKEANLEPSPPCSRAWASGPYPALGCARIPPARYIPGGWRAACPPTRPSRVLRQERPTPASCLGPGTAWRARRGRSNWQGRISEPGWSEVQGNRTRRPHAGAPRKRTIPSPQPRSDIAQGCHCRDTPHTRVWAGVTPARPLPWRARPGRAHLRRLDLVFVVMIVGFRRRLVAVATAVGADVPIQVQQPPQPTQRALS